MKIKHIMQHGLLAILACIAISAGATNGEDKNPIDVQYEKAIQKDPSTFGMRAAANKAREAWDKEMNKSYAHLMAKLNSRQQTALRASQRAWIKFRDAEGKSIAEIVAIQDGTIWQLTATNQYMELVRARALQLHGYESAMHEQE